MRGSLDFFRFLQVLVSHRDVLPAIRRAGLRMELLSSGQVESTGRPRVTSGVCFWEKAKYRYRKVANETMSLCYKEQIHSRSETV
jgi:hypothetical protein